MSKTAHERGKAAQQPAIILASSSPYRRALLERLGLPFSCSSPDIDETPAADETPQQLVERLAIAKAEKIAAANPSAIVIGSDQVACLNEQILGKPHTVANAVQQLRACSGNVVHFYTSLAVLSHREPRQQSTVATVEVSFRELSLTEIERYIEHDQPLDCAGSFKSEQLGVALFKSFRSDDPSALEGLPLISLCGMLRNLGVALP